MLLPKPYLYTVCLCFILGVIGLTGLKSPTQAKSIQPPPLICGFDQEKGRLFQEDWSEPLDTNPNRWQMVKAEVSASSQGAIVSNWQPDLANSWQAGLSTYLIHTNPEVGKVHFITEQAAEIGDGVIET